MSTQRSLSKFWSRVYEAIDPPAMQKPPGLRLVDCATSAFGDDGNRYAYLRADELIDAGGRFRHFQYGRALYVAKLASRQAALAEYRAAKQARKILRGVVIDGVGLDVVVPILIRRDSQSSILCAPDLGRSVHSSRPLKSEEELYTLLLDELLRNGVDWPGYVPRNLIHNRARRTIHGIDWEGTRFSRPGAAHVRTSTLFKLELNWRQIFPPRGLMASRIESLQRRPRPDRPVLDGFERAYQRIIPHPLRRRDVIQICCLATLRAELPCESPRQGTLAEMELGHFIDDIFPSGLSVLFTFRFAQIRTASEQAYRALVDRMTHVMIRAARRQMALGDLSFPTQTIRRELLLNLLDHQVLPHSAGSFPEMSLRCELQSLEQLRSRMGARAARSRSVHVDRMIAKIFAVIAETFDCRADLELLLRGSAGQGLLTSLSDVDFEISSPMHPRGCEGLEALLSAILAEFQIVAEGSQARPVEADLVTPTGDTRDAHEFSQIRRVDLLPVEHSWVTSVFSNVGTHWWQRLSIYERDVDDTMRDAPEYLFSAARATIARLAAKKGIIVPRTTDQLRALHRQLPSLEMRTLYRTIAGAVKLRETGKFRLKGVVREHIQQVVSRYGLPDPLSHVRPTQPVRSQPIQ